VKVVGEAPIYDPNACFEVGACVALLGVIAGLALEPETTVDDGETYAELHYKPHPPPRHR
jgi:hypothetical protein